MTEVLTVMSTMNEPNQLGHNMVISELGSHALSMSSLSIYLGLTSNVNLADLNLSDTCHGSSVMTPSSPLTPMRPFTWKLFNHANGVQSMGGGMVNSMNNHDDVVVVSNGCGMLPDSNLDPNANVYTPITLGNGDL